MASITIRKLDDEIRRQPRPRAASHGRSMEEEVRHIRRQAVERAPAPADPGESIDRRLAFLGGVEPDLPPREATPDAPRFD